MNKRLLLVDDSPSALLSLRRMLEAGSDFDIVGQARTAQEAIRLARETRPDLVTMDVYLDGQDGVETARAILATIATRVVLVTGLDPARADLAFRALEVGALDVLAKPPLSTDEASNRARRRFVSALQALSEVRLLGGSLKTSANARAASKQAPNQHLHALIALGASTGGPAVLLRVLQALPQPFPAPVVIVQHIEDAYAQSFAEWLQSTGHKVVVVEEGIPARPGQVYVANGHAHLVLARGGHLTSNAGPPRNFQVPSVDVFFESLAELAPRETFAALLSGMGEDGAQGLLALAHSGATTVVQSLDSCVVPGMPHAALRNGAAHLELTPEEIARAAERFVTTKAGLKGNST